MSCGDAKHPKSISVRSHRASRVDEPEATACHRVPGSWHRCQHFEEVWDRISTRTDPENHLEGVSHPHWELIVAADFFTVEVWTARGLQRYIVQFFIELLTLRVDIANVANGVWMSQIARNISDTVDGLLTGERYLIHDRDPLFTAEFLNILADSGVKSGKYRLGLRI